MSDVSLHSILRSCHRHQIDADIILILLRSQQSKCKKLLPLSIKSCHMNSGLALSRSVHLLKAEVAVCRMGPTFLPNCRTWSGLWVCSRFFLHESRRYVCRFCASHLSRVEKELLSRLQSNRDNDQPKTKKTPKQHTHSQEHQRGSNLQRNSLSHVGRVKKVKQGRRIQHGAQ